MTAPIAFPASLPRPMVSGYGIQPEDGLVATPFDAGPRRVRQRYTTVPASYPVQWDMDIAQYGVFEYWHAKVIHQGASWFSVKLMQGTGFHEVDARFIGPYAASASAPKRMTVQAKLEVRDRPFMSDAAYFIASLGDPSQFLSAEDAFDRLVNQSLPNTLE